MKSVAPGLENPDLFCLASYNYELPRNRIAQFPSRPRDSSRLLLADRAKESLEEAVFKNLPDFLHEGDLLVMNDTRVIPARILCVRGEILPARETDEGIWDCMVSPGKRFKPGVRFQLPDENGQDVQAEVISHSTIGRLIRFQGNLQTFLDRHGKTPLPPYIQRNAVPEDRKDYQTVYARKPGSIAAPTAGLHFTRRVLSALRDRGIGTCRITLHVGPGTFRPVKSEDIRKHELDPEYYQCSSRVWKRIRSAERVIAVGTTTTRALETIARTGEKKGFTNLFIYPGFAFQVVRGLITNFHLPGSSLLMLVSALGGYDLMRRAYDHAVQSGYRFYSYGDAMLIL